MLFLAASSQSVKDSHRSTAEDQESERMKKRGMLRRRKIEKTRPSLMRVLLSLRSSSSGRLAGEIVAAAAVVGMLAGSGGCWRSSCSREDIGTAAGSFGRPVAAAGGGDSAAPGGC